MLRAPSQTRTTLIATSASEFFTQDVEDIPADRNTFATTAEQRPHLNGATDNDGSSETGSRSLHVQAVKPADQGNNGPVQKPWKNFGQMRQFFGEIRERVGEVRYLEELSLAGVSNPAEFRSANKALECYCRLMRIAAEPEVA